MGSVVSSQTRVRTCVSCIGRQILNHWTTREVSFSLIFLYLTFNSYSVPWFFFTISSLWKCLNLWFSSFKGVVLPHSHAGLVIKLLSLKYIMMLLNNLKSLPWDINK